MDFDNDLILGNDEASSCHPVETILTNDKSDDELEQALQEYDNFSGSTDGEVERLDGEKRRVFEDEKRAQAAAKAIKPRAKRQPRTLSTTTTTTGKSRGGLSGLSSSLPPPFSSLVRSSFPAQGPQDQITLRDSQHHSLMTAQSQALDIDAVLRNLHNGRPEVGAEEIDEGLVDNDDNGAEDGRKTEWVGRGGGLRSILRGKEGIEGGDALLKKYLLNNEDEDMVFEKDEMMMGLDMINDIENNYENGDLEMNNNNKRNNFSTSMITQVRNDDATHHTFITEGNEISMSIKSETHNKMSPTVAANPLNTCTPGKPNGRRSTLLICQNTITDNKSPTSNYAASLSPIITSAAANVCGSGVFLEKISMNQNNINSTLNEQKAIDAPKCEDVTDSSNFDASSIPIGIAQLHGAFYWLDMKELPENGAVCLIGKVLPTGGFPSACNTSQQQQQYESCCVRVQNMNRSVMFRGIPGCNEEDIVDEIISLCVRQGITRRRIKPVKRFYVFEEETTRESRELQQWYKLTYNATLPMLKMPSPASLSLSSKAEDDNDTADRHRALRGFKSIELCIGERRSLVETFLLKRHFTGGPNFVRFDESLIPVPLGQRISHCRYEYFIDKSKSIHIWDKPFRTVDSHFQQQQSQQQTFSRQGRQSHITTLHYPPSSPPKLTVASVNLLTQLSTSGTVNEIYGISVAIAENNVTPDGGQKKALPAIVHTIGVRAFDNDEAPIPFQIIKACQAAGDMIVHLFSSERDVLFWFFGVLEQKDPDMILGHNVVSFTIDIILHRAKALKIPNWSKLGRFQQSQFPQLQKGAGGMHESTFQEKATLSGRMLCDTYLLAREHYKTSNYKLLSLSCELGLRGIYTNGITKSMADEPSPVLSKENMTNSDLLTKILSRLLNMSILAFELAWRLDVIPLTKQLCAQAGNTWSRVLIGNRSERIVSLLLHAFYAQKYVVPDQACFSSNSGGFVTSKRLRDGDDPDDKDANENEEDDAANAPSQSSKRTPKYKGGMVLDPVSGLYRDYILLLDFNSLYPSLIQEFDICFSTVNRVKNGTGTADNLAQIPTQENLSCSQCMLEGKECYHKRILPRTIEKLVNSRREIKRIMKTERNDEAHAQLEIRQKALKLTANSMYGCLGFEHSRFYAQTLAELITRKGRDTLLNTVALIPSLAPSVRVIYGDTDSVMLSTSIKDNLQMVRKLGNFIKTTVNNKYKRLEIDIDGIFRSILLMKKKKYAALSVVNWEEKGDRCEEVIKGLDMVRRDWCPLSRQASQNVVHKILGTNNYTTTNTNNYDGTSSSSHRNNHISDEDEDSVVGYIIKTARMLSRDVRAGDVYDLDAFVISKSLTKEPESYKGGSFPHATVALRMKARNQAVRVGDLIPFVICMTNTASVINSDEGKKMKEDGDAVTKKIGFTGDGEEEKDVAFMTLPNVVRVFQQKEQQGSSSSVGSLASRAFHVDEVRRDPEAYPIDVEWYLSTQIYPPILRLCQYIQGFSGDMLADTMGLRCTGSSGGGSPVDNPTSAGMQTTGYDMQYLRRFRTENLEDCFPLSAPLEIKCIKCKKMTPINPHKYIKEEILPVFTRQLETQARCETPEIIVTPFIPYSCVNCRSILRPQYVANAVDFYLRRRFQQFYALDGRLTDVNRFQSQISYLRALFDVPHLPGESRELLKLHKEYALRCVDVEGRLMSLKKSEGQDEEAVDPVLEIVKRYYNKTYGMRVDLAELLGKV